MDSNTVSNECKHDETVTALDVVNWLKRVCDYETEFFKNVTVIPFGDIAIIHPKTMNNNRVVEMIKKYWNIYDEVQHDKIHKM